MFSFFDRCSFCKQHNKERCYHWSVGDERSLNRFRQQLEEHLNLYLRTNGRHYRDVKRSTKIIYDPNDLSREQNEYNIDFVPNGVDDADRMEALGFFSNLLTTELRL